MKLSIRRFLIALVVFMLVAAPVAAYYMADEPELAAELPRMLGMNGESETVPLDGPLSAAVEGPFFEISAAPRSIDIDLRTLPQVGPSEKRPVREIGAPADPSMLVAVDDPVIQTGGGYAAAPAPFISFKGLDLQNWGAGWPPDTHGEIGPNHYIQAVNTSIGIFDKTTGSLLAAFTFDDFFQANGGTGDCANANYGDPIVLYDHISGRWIITDFAINGPYYECIAVSKSADPVSGGWWLYSLKASGTALNDYPKLGVWSNGIYMSANMFRYGAFYSGVKVWALNRSDMTNGKPLRTVAFTLGNSYFSLLPANLEGTNPPAGSPAYFISDYGSNTRIQLWKFKVNWTTPSLSKFNGPTNITTASASKPSGRVPQLGSAEQIDIIGDRLMTWVQYRNVSGVESLWVSRSATAGSSTGIRWYELRKSGTVWSAYQQSTFAPDSNYRWMPSIAVNKFGDMAIGYSVSSASMYPAIRYAGRLSTDPLNTLGFTETSLIEGTGAQDGGYNRWGDYSSMTVDPVDGCTFWFTSEYYETTGNNWQTRIGAFRFPNCP